MKTGRIRGIRDDELAGVLMNHTQRLSELMKVGSALIKERRRVVVLHAIEVAAIIYLMWRH